MAKLSMNRPSEGKNTAREVREDLERQRRILAAGEAEAKVRISVDVPVSIHEQLRLYAWSRRKSMNRLINEVIRDLLTDQQRGS